MKPLIVRGSTTALANKPSKAAIRNTMIAHNEKRSYKNISIYITKLPPTPRKFRDEHGRAKVSHNIPSVLWNRGKGVPEERSSGKRTCNCAARKKMAKKQQEMERPIHSARVSVVSAMDDLSWMRSCKSISPGPAITSNARRATSNSPRARGSPRVVILRVTVHRHKPETHALNDPAQDLDAQALLWDGGTERQCNDYRFY
jgi:hypothetical protein